LQGDLQGDYLPLTGSWSYAPRPEGADAEAEALLKSQGILFLEPDKEVSLSAGYGRHWPDARGVWVDNSRKLVAWVNEEDHLRMVSMESGQALQKAFGRLCTAHAALQEALTAEGHAFAQSSRLGFLGACPSNIGTCLTVTATVKLPLLGEKSEFGALCESLGVQAHSARRTSNGGQRVFDISNIERLGSSEVEQVNLVADACRTLLDIEIRLEGGEEVDFEAWDDDESFEENGFEPQTSMSLLGLGAEEYPGFPVDELPDKLPDLSRHWSLMAEVIQNDPSIYTGLKGIRTRGGVSLARCLKTGIDNCGHPMIKTVGLVAGDAECYEAFAKLFEPVLRAAHPGCSLQAKHPSDLDCSKVSDEPMDPMGGHVLSVRVRCQRNLSGMRFPPAASLEERREVERSLARAFEALTGEFAGEYRPLPGSRNQTARNDDIDPAEAHQLADEDFLFTAPDSPVVLASGTGRDWPQARGVFVSRGRDLAAWVNEEDHLRLWAMQSGQDLKAVLRRYCQAEAALHASLRQDGHGFASSSRFGFLTVCPSKVGTAMQAEVTAKLPLLSSQPGFKALCRRLKLQGHVADPGIGGIWDLSNSERLGISEVDQVNTMIGSTRQLVALESRLARGEEVDLASVG